MEITRLRCKMPVGPRVAIDLPGGVSSRSGLLALFASLGFAQSKVESATVLSRLDLGLVPGYLLRYAEAVGDRLLRAGGERGSFANAVDDGLDNAKVFVVFAFVQPVNHLAGRFAGEGCNAVVGLHSAVAAWYPAFLITSSGKSLC